MATSSAVIGRFWSSWLSKAPASMPILLLLAGCPKAATPIDLTPFGATGCHLYIPLNLLVFLPGGVTNTQGSASIRLPVPKDLGIYGAQLSMQTLVPDLFANAAGWVTSSGIGVRIGVDPRSALIHMNGNLSATTGWLVRGNGLVTRFKYQ